MGGWVVLFLNKAFGGSRTVLRSFAAAFLFKMKINTAGTRLSAYSLGWVRLTCRLKVLSLERQCSETAL